ncbi:uncharacterized protein METZ01_LOCUS46401, partial [marine metagenome]
VNGATGERHDPRREQADPFELVRRHNHGPPGGDGVADELVDDVASSLVEAGVGLIEQPQLRATYDECRQRGSSPLAGRQPVDGQVEESVVEAEALEGANHPFNRRLGVEASSPGPEADILGDREVLVEAGRMAQQRHSSAHRPTLGAGCEVVAEHRHRAGLGGQEAGAEAQQGGLAGPVGALQQDGLARLDAQIHAGQRREASEQGDRSIEFDHGHPPTVPAPGVP